VTFEELGLKESSIKALTKMGYVTPSEIQEKAIPALLAGDIDFIGQAQTGTGKTAAFVLPLLEKLDHKQKTVQVLILAPTRELANQIEGELIKFTAFEKVRSLAVYGGTPIVPQLRALKQNAP
jgi:ATP-dependent RNA helicase DeaD